MGSRGPPPTPTALLALRGSWRASRPQEPLPEPGRPLCPAWLDPEAQKVWRALVPQLARMGVLTKLDGNALARYCVLFVRWRNAEEFLRVHGESHIIKDKWGKPREVRVFPHVKMAASLADLLLRIEVQFGLTPAARARLIATQTAEQVQPNDNRRYLNVS